MRTLVPRPEDFTSTARGPATTARIGLWLGVAFTTCFVTGFWSHLQYAPPAWLPLGPSPSWLYRLTQGLHVISGVAAIPLLLVKLWSVFPRLFLRPPITPICTALLHGLERLSVLVLVGAAIFQVVSGSLNIVQWYPWDFSFRATHEAVAWIAIGAIAVHVAVKLPTIRSAFATTIAPGADEVSAGPGRRTVVRAALLSSGLAALLTAGQTVPGLRRISVFGVRDGGGPQGLPVNRTARAAGATAAASDRSFALEVRSGARQVMLTRAQLAELPQQTHHLPIACVEGWSQTAEWTGPTVLDVLALVDAPEGSSVLVQSMQTRGAFRTSVLPAAYVADHRTLLALKLNGEDLSLDHGFPCRIIAPNRPGVLQTKWVRSLEART
ncbi:MAG TPA: molybdopterin-dependent oxidoreductase [Aeromicrobium sp.]|nr:molybdopterin-dependent oxidoreductase [Aeromicrobium sp.]